MKRLLLLFLLLGNAALVTCMASPTITSFSPANGAIGTLVTITGTNLSSPTAFTIGGANAIVVSNTGTTLVGLVMPGAVTGAVSVTTAGGTVAGGSNFTVTTTPFPSAQQGNKLVGTGGVSVGYQGFSISISADGNTAIVGGIIDNSDAGAAWVYTRTGGVWTQQGNKLVGTGATGNAYQGYSASISADGNTAIVGGWGDNSGAGAAWVYTRSGGVWTQQGNKLVGTGAAGLAGQGSSVSLSADGNTAFVGGVVDNNYAGAVWVYTRTGGVWTQQGNKLVGTGAVGLAGQGVSVSLSANGNTAIVGGEGDNSGAGAVWVYTQSGGVWAQQGNKLVGTGAVNGANGALQGIFVSLSADGNTAIVGGNGDNSYVGAAWVYTRSGGVWTQQGSKLVGTGAVYGTAGVDQGQSVSLSADGNTAIVGGYVDNKGAGAVWVYTRSSGVWTQRGSKLTGTGAVGSFSYQGVSASLSADGSTAIEGGDNDNTEIGAAWVFIAAPSGTITSFSPASGPVGTLVTITGTNLTSPTAFTIGGANAIVVSNTGTTLVGLVMPGAVTGAVSVTTAGGTANGSSNFTVTPTPFPGTQQGNKLVGAGAVGVAGQGEAVSVSADGNTAIVGGSSDNSGVGAAWVYTRSVGVWTQQGKLVGTGAISQPSQGRSVSLSADGNTAIVGGLGDNSDVGAAWVYTRSGGVWTQQGNKLVGTGAVGTPEQGSSVSLSADGNTAIVGGYIDGVTGAVWVYTRSGGVWTQQGNKLVGTGAVGNALQGASVSLSADGNTAIVGGYYDNSDAGAAWVYTRSGGVWTQQGSKLAGTGASSSANQGASVSLSANGNTAIVGGPNDNSGAGAAWVYIRSGGVWTQQGNKLAGTGATGGARQGNSVSLSADGNTAIVGGYQDNSNAGAVWIYTRSGGVWTQQGSKLTGTGATSSADQGISVSLSADGSTAIDGGFLDNSGAGATWVFITAPCTPVGGTISPAYSLICSGGTQALAISGANGNTYQWQISPDNINWSNISGATNNSVYTTASATTTQYYRLLSESSACGNVSSTTAEVDVSNPAITVTAGTITDQNITLNWAPVGFGNYSVSWSGASSGSSSNVTPPKTITGLNPGGTYSITVTQTGTGLTGCPASGTVASVTTLCSAPTGLTATAPSNNQLNVNWTGGAGNYRVFYRPLYTANTYYTQDVTAATSATITKIGNNTLPASTTYEVYVTTKDCPTVGAIGEPGLKVYVTTPPTLSCAAPVFDSVKSTCPIQIEVWMHPGSSPSGVYQIYLQQLTPTIQGKVSYSFTGNYFTTNIGSAGQTYLVAAASNCGGTYSNLAIWQGNITTKPLCSSLNNLIISNTTCNGFTASWNIDPCLSNNVSYYDISLREQGNVNWNHYGVAPAGTAYDIVNWLSKGSTYQVYVSSIYSCDGYTLGGPASQVSTITMLSAGCRDEDQQPAPVQPSVQQYSPDKNEVMSIYPNPNNGEFMLDISSLSTSENTVRVEVMNMLGQTVETHFTSISNGHLSEFIHLPETTASGYYVVRVTVGNNVYTTKLDVSK